MARQHGGCRGKCRVPTRLDTPRGSDHFLRITPSPADERARPHPAGSFISASPWNATWPEARASRRMRSSSTLWGSLQSHPRLPQSHLVQMRLDADFLNLVREAWGKSGDKIAKALPSRLAVSVCRAIRIISGLQNA